jgi:transcriptional regulator with XRE-family HTH domain
MFAIGSTLREARLRRGLALADVETKTRIRAKYLQALEDERFDLLPGSAYTRAFLRGYADYLGLEAELFLDELNARLPLEEEPFLPEVTALERRRLRLSRSVIVALWSVAAVSLLAVLAWQSSTNDRSTPPALIPLEPAPAQATLEPAGAQATTGSERAAKASPGAVRRKAEMPRLVILATRGDCWLSVRVGSRAGEVLYEGFLEEGQTLRFKKRQLWIRLGAPQNLAVRLNGKAVPRLPTDTANVAVTPAGLRTLSPD